MHLVTLVTHSRLLPPPDRSFFSFSYILNEIWDEFKILNHSKSKMALYLPMC